MSRAAWHQKRLSKGFNVAIYRALGSLLVISLAVNGLLTLLLSFIYFNRPGHVFYSTDGVTPPARLTSRNSPNESAVPLLASDPVNSVAKKEIPN